MVERIFVQFNFKSPLSFDYFNFLSRIVAIQFNRLAAGPGIEFGPDVDEIKIEMPLPPAEDSIVRVIEVVTLDSDDSNPAADHSSEFDLIVFTFLIICLQQILLET